ncbi:probable calcium-binding protein CML18 [Triticum dicoccoides]|uniref:probable calcium-binding protein CML18 n=1 Tax=Triticum dicoccoides TaxID=85692 RepID=UPI0018900BCB|nr:probable calcium-binding protein CML18 [Triticum dicoccoides]
MANGVGSAKAEICAGLGMPMAELEQVFRRYDANGDGKISADELASVLRALGAPPGPGEVQSMMEEMDADRDGFVDLHEFAAFHCGPCKGSAAADAKEEEAATEAELKEAFRMYDADRNGLISARELHRVLRQLGEKCSVADCSRMIRSVDADGDGSVNFEEFKKMMGGGVGALDKPGEMLARPCGKVEVVDEDVMSHAQLSDDNLLIVPDMTHGVLEVDADHSVLVLGYTAAAAQSPT